MELIDAWDDASTLGNTKVAVSSHSNGYDPNSTLSSGLPTYDSAVNDFELVESETYSEIAVPAGVTSSRAVSNQGYIFEDDLYADNKFTSNTNSRVSQQLSNSHVLPGSLDRRRVSDLYSKPHKGKRKPITSTSSQSSGGFDHPEVGGSIYESAHEHDNSQEIYGYSTSLA